MAAEREVRAIIADDSEHDAKLMALALKHAGYAVDYVRVDTADGLTAALAARRPDVVLTDHAMPTFSSLDVLDILRASGPQAPPVIVVSGQIGEENLARAFHAGAVDYVSKDRLTPLLANAVARALEAQRARAALEEASWQLRRQEKLAALGTFVRGVAHEINNPLSYMMMSAEMAKQSLVSLQRSAALEPKARDEVAEALQATDTLMRGCQRIEYIVSALQRVARSGEGPREVVQVADALEGRIPAPPERVRFAKRLESRTPVRVNVQDLGDVVRALLHNAYEAMVDAPQGEVELTARDTPTGVRIEVRDSGAGIPREKQASVFLPFFTTKPAGVGLSLSIARRLVQDHGGDIGFVSEPGKGSTFWVELPPAATARGSTPVAVTS